MNESMTIRAPADGKFLLRFLLIGLACFGFLLYCLYDGLYAYPKYLLEPALEYQRLVDQKEEHRWIEVARQKGWDEAKPKKSVDEARASIVWQFVMAAFCLLFGVPLLLLYFRTRWTWIEANESGITTSWGVSFRFDQIFRVDKTRWDKKGIARIFFERDGQKKSFILDDFKYQREPTDRILELIESRVPPGIIVSRQAVAAENA